MTERAFFPILTLFLLLPVFSYAEDTFERLTSLQTRWQYYGLSHYSFQFTKSNKYGSMTLSVLVEDGEVSETEVIEVTGNVTTARAELSAMTMTDLLDELIEFSEGSLTSDFTAQMTSHDFYPVVLTFEGDYRRAGLEHRSYEVSDFEVLSLPQTYQTFAYSDYGVYTDFTEIVGSNE